MKQYTYTTEKIGKNTFKMRCYDTTKSTLCLDAYLVHEKIYENVSKKQANLEYRTFIQNHMIF